jgi:hypothetical protein
MISLCPLGKLSFAEVMIVYLPIRLSTIRLCGSRSMVLSPMRIDDSISPLTAQLFPNDCYPQDKRQDHFPQQCPLHNELHEQFPWENPARCDDIIFPIGRRFL